MTARAKRAVANAGVRAKTLSREQHCRSSLEKSENMANMEVEKIWTFSVQTLNV